MKKNIIFFLLVLLTISYSSAQHSGNREIIRIMKNPKNNKAIIKMNLDVLLQKDDQIFIAAGAKDLNKLDDAGIIYSFTTINLTSSTEGDSSTSGGINGAYHSYLELENDLFLLESSYPHLAKVETIGYSHENRCIYALKISDYVNQEENEAQIIFLGGHHAREWISVEVPYLIGKHLLENYSSDPKIKNLVDKSEIWIVPLVNPDGLVYSIYYYRYWRKNRRNNEDGSYGVDLNRNYGYKWGYDDIGSSPDPYSNLYRGPSSFSEPETQAVREFMLGKNFRALVSYHSYAQFILYPWGYTDALSPLYDIGKNLAEQMSKLIEKVNGTIYEFGTMNSYCVTNGDITDWSLGVFGIPSFTIELPPKNILSGGFFNSEQDIILIFQENLPAALYLIEWAVDQHSCTSPHLLPEGHHKKKPKEAIRK